MTDAAEAKQDLERARDVVSRLTAAIGQVVVGQEEVVRGVLIALSVGGHALLEGVPGLAKTLLVRTLARTLSIDFARIQCTPDLMPSDVVGAMILRDVEGGGHTLAYQPGPVHANLVLVDEINRATPRTQSALLEAMQEQAVTVGDRTRPLPDPFFLVATQNPIEQEGTYPLPEAQLDRFLFKLAVGYPGEEEARRILDQTCGEAPLVVEPAANAADVLQLRRAVRRILVSDQVRDLAVRIMRGSWPAVQPEGSSVREWIALGASPRAAQGLILAAKARALFDGRFGASVEDVIASVHDVLRHRLVPTFAARRAGISSDMMIEEILRVAQDRSSS